ncbi:MAG: ATPase, partial [Pseudomonadota bacterium]|nr:ATPase [Pseudomonadota bacterium]
MPQIEQLAATYSSQIFWMLVFFGFTFFVIGRGMVPKVMDTVAKRDTQIADDLLAAERARKQADAEEESWRERENANRAKAHALIAEARATAATETEQRLAAAQVTID